MINCGSSHNHDGVIRGVTGLDQNDLLFCFRLASYHLLVMPKLQQVRRATVKN